MTYLFLRSMRGTIWNRHGAPRNIEIQHISPNPTIAHSNSFGQADQLDSNLGHDSHLGHLDASNTSSEVPSRQSSVSNLRASEGPYLTQERSSIPKEQSSPKKSSQITPRYMNWYTKSKSTIIQPQSLDAKQLRRKEIRSQSIPHNLRRNSITQLPEVNLPSPFEDDTESEISSLMQKKSVFTIAYDDMASSNIQPPSSATGVP